MTDTKAETAPREKADSNATANKEDHWYDIALREAYVIGGGTVGGAIREGASAIVEHPKETAIKLAESVGVGALLYCSQFGSAPIKLAGRAAAAYLGFQFYRDTLDVSRWNKLGEAVIDTAKSGKNTDRNFAIVQHGLGHLLFDTTMMIGGAKLGARLGHKGITGAMTLTGFGPRSVQMELGNLPAASAKPLESVKRETASSAGKSNPDSYKLISNSEGTINAAQHYNQSIYKFVPAKIAAMDARNYNGNSISYSCDGQTRLVGDTQGNLLQMRVRKGATPDDVAQLVLAGGYTELIAKDALAHDAARQAAIDARTWPTAQAKFQQAAIGAQDYVSGKPARGNAYTDYLMDRFGYFTSQDAAWAKHILTDISSPASPWNAVYAPATDSLFQCGIPITEINRAAAANPFVMAIPMWQRRTAIPAVARYASELAATNGPIADNMQHNITAGKIASELSRAEVEAARAIHASSNGADFNVSTIQAVARLLESSAGRQDARQIYLNLRTKK